MKKTLLSIGCMSIVTIALCALCQYCHGFHQSGAHYYEQQLSGVKDWFGVFIVIGFFTGFLPAYIYESIKALHPAQQAQEAPAQAQKSQVSPSLYVGQQFTSEGANCTLRVKAIKSHKIEIELIMGDFKLAA